MRKYKQAMVGVERQKRDNIHGYTGYDYARDYAEVVNRRLSGQGNDTWWPGDETAEADKKAAIGQVEQAIAEYGGIGKELLFCEIYEGEIEIEDEP